MIKPVSLVAAITFTWAGVSAAGQLAIPANPLWEPMVDDVYLQEVGSLIDTESP